MNWDQLHDEDVLFEFRGRSADDLTPGRFYRGTVDGYAEFGVFVTIGESVTGLLHRNNIDGRLENLGWDVGEEVIVQVEGVRENGNVDLAWSIRQSDAEFRGAGVDDPDGDAERIAPPKGESDEPDKSASDGPDVSRDDERDEPEDDVPEEEASESAARQDDPPAEESAIASLADRVGDRLRVVGRVDEIRQTNGPTIFTVTDHSGTIECAAFEEAGVRAYPDVSVEDAIAVDGRVERHRGDLQLETDAIEELDDDERHAVLEDIEAVERERARPDDDTMLIPGDGDETIADLATTVRRAVFDRRNVILRHPTTVDGVVSSAAIEHAIRELSNRSVDGDGHGWFVTRRPMDDAWYDLGDAMYDVTDAAERDDLILVVGAGANERDEAALDFLDLYEVEHLVVDHLDDDVAPRASNLAGMIDATVRDQLAHLPAIAAGYDIPADIRGRATEHGYDVETIRERHEAIALVAYYQRFDDKRELIADLLFDGDEAGGLATHVSEQFRERLATAVATGLDNATREDRDGTSILTLDAHTQTQRFAFPPRRVLAAAIDRETDDDVVLLFDEDAAFIAGADLDELDRLASSVDRIVQDASVTASRDRITFLAGRRAAVRDALIDAVVPSVA